MFGGGGDGTIPDCIRELMNECSTLFLKHLSTQKISMKGVFSLTLYREKFFFLSFFNHVSGQGSGGKKKVRIQNARIPETEPMGQHKHMQQSCNESNDWSVSIVYSDWQWPSRISNKGCFLPPAAFHLEVLGTELGTSCI